MLALYIIESEVRDFMNKLLREEVFDGFEVRGVELNTLTKFEINGKLDKDFLPDDQKETERLYCTWSELRPHILNLIKGTKRPKTFKIVFSLPTQAVESLHKSASAYFLNLTFDGSIILITAMSSEKNFQMDKSVGNVWDEYATDFFKKNKIVVSTQI